MKLGRRHSRFRQECRVDVAAPRRAFTLVELLLATALMTVLMLGILAVVTQLGAAAVERRPSDAVATADTAGETRSSDMQALDAWMTLLQQDLCDGLQGVIYENNRLTLTGYMALGRPEGERVHRPVRVVYELREVDGRSWLVRQQTLRDEVGTAAESLDLVCRDISRFTWDTRFHPNVGRVRVWTLSAAEPSYERMLVASGGSR